MIVNMQYTIFWKFINIKETSLHKLYMKTLFRPRSGNFWFEIPMKFLTIIVPDYTTTK